MAHRHLDFGCLASITVREHISALLSHQFMVLSQGNSMKLTHPPVASYLIQKENQCIITTISRPPLTWLTSAPTALCLSNPLQPHFNGPLQWSSNTLPATLHEALIPRQAGPVSDLCRCHSLFWNGSLIRNLQGCSPSFPSVLCSSPLISKAPPNYPSASPFPIHLMPPSLA